MEENIGNAATQLSAAQTCSHFIATVSAREMPDNNNVQMCVLSVGLDVEGVVAQLIHQRMQKRSRRVFCVVVPENLPPGSVTRLANAIKRHLHLLCSEESSNARIASGEATANKTASSATVPRSTAAAGGALPAVVAIEEGTGTKERCALFQQGGVVLLTSRSLCADVLHRRLAVELVGMALLLLPHSLLGGSRVQDALAPQTAFCAELLLRSGTLNSAGLGNAERRGPPPIVVVSDAPMLMQSLVQRHHMGAERFVQQLHIGDIQLFPRFRLDFVRHFEELSRRDGSPHARPLDVDRVVAPVSPSVLALDGLLAKIVLETLQELQRLEQQQALHQQRCSGGGEVQPGTGWSPAARRAAAAADADEDVGAQRFLPRARLTATTLNGHLDYSGYPRGGTASSTATDATARAAPMNHNSSSRMGAPASSASLTATSSYVRQGWRVRKDDKGIWFNGISDAAALSMDFSDLDSDLRAVVQRHESQWPFRLLTESLIDVRRLRRATRGTAFSFLLHLESVLEKRLPQRSVYGTGARPPAALWTLSSHFNDVVTVATHRIGTVVYNNHSNSSYGGSTTTHKPGNALPGTAVSTVKVGGAPRTVVSMSVAVSSPPPPSPTAESAAPSQKAEKAEDVVVVVDSSSEDDNEEIRKENDASAAYKQSSPSGALAAVQAPQLVPNTDEQETDVEVVVRLVMSWCRTALRRRDARSQQQQQQQQQSIHVQNAVPAVSSSTSAQYPTLLLLTFGAGAVVRYTERLTHDLETYQQLQLRRFMSVYQTKYGVELAEYSSDSATGDEAAAVEQQLRTALFETDNPDDAYSEDEEGEEAGSVAGEADDAKNGTTLATTTGNAAGTTATAADRKFLRQRSGAATVFAEGSVSGGSHPAAGPSSLFGDEGVSAFHQALLSQAPAAQRDAPPAKERTSAPPLSAAVTTDVSLAESGTAAASPSTASSASAMSITLAVERVRAGAVTLQPIVTVPSTALSGEGAPASADGPRVLIFDGGQLSATELTMLLDGSHEALAFSAPTTAPHSVGDGGAESVEAPSGVDARLHVDRIVLARQQLSVLRQLEMAQDELPATLLRKLKVQLITTSLAEVDFKKAVQAEQVAFESLAHTKATLTGTLLVDQSSLRQTEEALESGLQVARRRGIVRKGSTVARLGDKHFAAAVAVVAAPPCVIFDEREFRSTLPYDLYKRGVDLVPLTLTTADYVLSPEYAVERKSVRDYFQSVMSSRIQHQLAALSRKYARPLCLIEFHRGIPFRMLQNRIYGRTARLMAGYPRVGFVWARSPAHAAGMLVTLKKSVAVENVDPSDPSLTGSALEPGSAADVGGLAANAAEREAAHYAARVLSRFPGITHQNAPRVMQLCGSLIGLATISQASLATVMEEAEAEQLYTFLHTPFHERVD